jgi:RNA polymerase sigma-70 factor (ECF subfamily)
LRELEGRLRPFIARRLRDDADVDDVLQDVSLRMQRRLSGLRDDERFGPWVYQVALPQPPVHARSTHDAPGSERFTRAPRPDGGARVSAV